MQVDYLKRKKEIDEMTITDIEISKEDIDLAGIHGSNLNELKKGRLEEEKKKQFKELQDKYGIKEPVKKEKNIIDKVHGKIDDSIRNLHNERQRLWDMLEGKGLIKKKEEPVHNG